MQKLTASEMSSSSPPRLTALRFDFIPGQRFGQPQPAGDGTVQFVEKSSPDQEQRGLPQAVLVGKKYRQQPHHGVHHRQGVGEKGQNLAAQAFVPETELVQAQRPVFADIAGDGAEVDDEENDFDEKQGAQRGFAQLGDPAVDRRRGAVRYVERIGVEQGADRRGDNGSQPGELAVFEFRVVAQGNGAHEMGEVVPHQDGDGEKQHQNGVQQFGFFRVRQHVVQAPHAADGHQGENDGVDELVEDAVGQLGHLGMGVVAGRKPAVDQVEGHGDKQQKNPYHVNDGVLIPHHGHGAQHAAEDERQAPVNQNRRDALGQSPAFSHVGNRPLRFPGNEGL